MLPDGVVEYYTRRRLASVKMSQAASEPGIQKIHLEFARRYAALAGLSGQSAGHGLPLPGGAGDGS